MLAESMVFKDIIRFRQMKFMATFRWTVLISFSQKKHLFILLVLIAHPKHLQIYWLVRIIELMAYQ